MLPLRVIFILGLNEIKYTKNLWEYAFQRFTIVYLKNFMYLFFGGRYLISWELF